LQRVAAFGLIHQSKSETQGLLSRRCGAIRARLGLLHLARGTVKTVYHECGTGREQPNSSGIRVREDQAAPPRILTAGDQFCMSSARKDEPAASGFCVSSARKDEPAASGFCVSSARKDEPTGSGFCVSRAREQDEPEKR
jgi:hypothetical protein